MPKPYPGIPYPITEWTERDTIRFLVDVHPDDVARLNEYIRMRVVRARVGYGIMGFTVGFMSCLIIWYFSP